MPIIRLDSGSGNIFATTAFMYTDDNGTAIGAPPATINWGAPGDRNGDLSLLDLSTPNTPKFTRQGVYGLGVEMFGTPQAGKKGALSFLCQQRDSTGTQQPFIQDWYIVMDAMNPGATVWIASGHCTVRVNANDTFQVEITGTYATVPGFGATLFVNKII